MAFPQTTVPSLVRKQLMLCQEFHSLQALSSSRLRGVFPPTRLVRQLVSPELFDPHQVRETKRRPHNLPIGANLEKAR